MLQAWKGRCDVENVEKLFHIIGNWPDDEIYDESLALKGYREYDKGVMIIQRDAGKNNIDQVWIRESDISVLISRLNDVRAWLKSEGE